MNGNQLGSCNTTNSHWKKWWLWMKLSCCSWLENTCTTPPTPVLRWRCMTKHLIYSLEHYEGCGGISRAQTFEILVSGGTDLEALLGWIFWGGQQKNPYQCWNFLQLAGRSEDTLGSLLCIYVWPSNRPQQESGRAPSWRWVKLDMAFCKVCVEDNGTWSHKRVSGWPDLCSIKRGDWWRCPRGSS